MTALLLLFCMWMSGAAAADEPTDAQLIELDRARAEIANQVQLSAYDLIDEMVYDWTKEPPFDEPTPVVLAGVTVPVGLGTGLGALVENHVGDVVGDNSTTHVQLVHCPQCTAVVVHSGPEGTVVSRGFDNPGVLEDLGATTGRHALFIDIEAEGTWLVLRARITRLTPDLPIVWSHTSSASAGSGALLRGPNTLKSASDARQEYIDTLRGRGPFSIPLRFAVRTYAQPGGGEFGQQGTPPPPFIWLQTGVEVGVTDARAWTSSLLIGGSFIPQAYQGLMAQSRVSRLLTGRSRSLTRPDLYGFVGASVNTVWGAATASFQDELLTADQIILGNAGDPPRFIFGTFQLGADLRVGNRIGISGSLEALPSLQNSPNIGEYIFFAGVKVQSLSMEVSFWF